MSIRRLFTLLIMFALLLTASLALTRAQEIACDPAVNTFVQAETLYSQGNYAAAVSAYTCALQNRPDNAAILNGRGNAYRQLGNTVEALADYNRAIELDSSVAIFFNNRGFIKYQQGAMDEALADFNQAIALDPRLAYAYNNRGLIYAERGQIDLATSDFNRAIRLGHDPISWPTLNLATLNVDVAMISVLTVHMLPFPVSPALEDLYAEGQDAYKVKDYDKAVDIYSQLIEADPEYSRFYYARVASHYANGDYQNAAEDFTQAIQREPKVYFFLWRGHSYSLLNEIDKALSDYAEAIHIEPTFLNAYLFRSLIYYQIGEYDLARSDFKKWVMGNGNSSQFVEQPTPESGETISLDIINFHFYSFSLRVKKGQLVTIETSTSSDSEVDPMLVLVESDMPQIIDEDSGTGLNAAIQNFTAPEDSVYTLYLMHPGTPGPLDLTITLSTP